MGMHATSLIYSSHNCGHDIHYDWIVRRALETGQKRILHLPMSEGSQFNRDDPDRQEYGYSKFRWFFDRFNHQGLQHHPFYWSSNMTKRDADKLCQMLATYEVVLFGGGNSPLGMRRYEAIGERFYGNPHKIGGLIHDRQSRGLLTVGFSAGADHLAEVMSESAWGEEAKGFGVSSRIAVTLHHEAGREGTLLRGARKYPNILWFGLPNDSGLATQQGVLPSGRWWQVIEIVLDKSWDVPQEVFHIKTRYGAKVEHYYADGRHWSFANGDQVLRISGDGVDGCWIANHQGIREYYSQNLTGYGSVGDILGSH
jgi:hypothetical protein